MNKVLVTGGCGYIGSHTIIDLIENGFSVISVDNFSNSNPEVLQGIEEITGKKIENFNVDLSDAQATRKIFEAHPDISGIIHFAAFKHVGESVSQPLRYFHNNLSSLLNILNCMTEFGVKHFIFSSSCSVYGNSEVLPVTEETPLQKAESPYARTKQIGEQMIEDFSYAYPEYKSILLRYFNPAGAHESAKIGEDSSNKASNLVPVITETAIGKRDSLTVFGDDYSTRDGSCIRDYIHVMDLANAHTKALIAIQETELPSNCEVFNLGIGAGVTVLEAIKAFEKVSGNDLNYQIGPRRDGDVEAIYANYEKAAKWLNWHPKYNMEDIMRTAWAWEQVRSKKEQALQQ
jgi:UDP-glucose 4-epimerase